MAGLTLLFVSLSFKVRATDVLPRQGDLYLYPA